MALYCSESTACSMYRQAIHDHRDQLESALYPTPWVHLEKRCCLRDNHREVEAMRKMPAKAAIKELVDLVLSKGDIDTYTTFSKAVYSKNELQAKEIFPFADSIGGIPVPVLKKGPPQPSNKPVALWLVPSKTDCNNIISVVGCKTRGSKKSVGSYYCQEVFVSGDLSLTIHIAYPSGPSSTTTTDPVDLLFQFSPRPHVAVMTGTCCANEGAANLGDVCVITPRSEVSLLAEIEHMTELWKLETGSLVPENLKPPRSVFQQMVCLARIYAELQLSEQERSQWFKDLKLDVAKPLRDNPGVRRCVPDPEKLLQSKQASGFWSPAEKGSSFPHVPCDSLCNEAKLSMLFASLNHSSISDPTEPDVIFGRVGRFKGSEGRIVCSPEVANFYTAAGMLNGMQYVAALGVSSVDGQDCEEDGYEQFASLFSVHVMWRIIQHILKTLQL